MALSFVHSSSSFSSAREAQEDEKEKRDDVLDKNIEYAIEANQICIHVQ